MVSWLSAAGLVGGLVYLGVLEARGGTLLDEGQPAPAFTMPRHEGGSLSLEGLRGKVVMLDFWATWCPPCVAEMPSLVKLAKEYEDQGLVFVAANRDDADVAQEAVEAFIARKVPGLRPHAAFASDFVAASYRVTSLPTLYFIDGEGRVLEAHSGAERESTLRRWIERSLSANRQARGEAPPPDRAEK